MVRLIHVEYFTCHVSPTPFVCYKVKGTNDERYTGRENAIGCRCQKAMEMGCIYGLITGEQLADTDVWFVQGIFFPDRRQSSALMLEVFQAPLATVYLVE